MARSKKNIDTETIKKIRKMSNEEKKKLIEGKKQQKIMFEKDLNDKVIIYHETFFVSIEDNLVDALYYYVDVNAELDNPELIIYTEKYSDKMQRKKALEEWKKKKKRFA